MDDQVKHPNHYISSTGLETIEVIEAFTEGLEGMEAVCTANIIKYICRWKKKNGVQDVEKAIEYAEMLVAYLKSKDDNNADKIDKWLSENEINRAAQAMQTQQDIVENYIANSLRRDMSLPSYKNLRYVRREDNNA